MIGKPVGKVLLYRGFAQILRPQLAAQPMRLQILDDTPKWMAGNDYVSRPIAAD